MPLTKEQELELLEIEAMAGGKGYADDGEGYADDISENPDKPVSYLQHQKEYFKTDIPRILSSPFEIDKAESYKAFQAPTTLGGMTGLDRKGSFPERLGYEAASVPERVGRTAAGLVNVAGDVALTPIKLGAGMTNRVMGGVPYEKVVNPALQGIGRGYEGLMSRLSGGDEASRTNLEAAATLGGAFLPLGVGKTLKGLGRGLESGSKTGMLKSWKMKERRGRNLAPDKLRAQRELADIWYKEKLSANPEKAYDVDIPNRIDDLTSQRENILSSYVESGRVKPHSLQNQVDELSEAFKTSEIPGFAKLKKRQVDDVFDKIRRALGKRGFGKEINPKTEEYALFDNVDVSDIPRINEIIRQEFDPFASGKFSDDVILEKAAARSLYYKNLLSFGDEVPEAHALNRKISKMITLQEIAGDAAAKAKGENFMGVGDIAAAHGMLMAALHGNIPAVTGIGAFELVRKSKGALATGAAKASRPLIRSGEGLEKLYGLGERLPSASDLDALRKFEPPPLLPRYGPLTKTDIPPSRSRYERGLSKLSLASKGEGTKPVIPLPERAGTITPDLFGLPEAVRLYYEYHPTELYKIPQWWNTGKVGTGNQ
jgi:hypothetical protein